MKTSNYILLLLFMLFFGSFITVCSNPTIFKHSVSTEESSIMKTIPLADFSVVVAEKDTKLTLLVNNSDEPCQINIEDKWMNTKYKPIYEVRLDTLFIKRNPNTMNFPNFSYSISIQCPEIKSFLGNPNSEVTIVNSFAKNKQLFLLDNAKLKFEYYGKDSENAKTKIENGKFVSNYPFSNIKIIAKNSKIKFRTANTIIDLDLDLKGSYFYIDNQSGSIFFNSINGSIKDNSRVDINMFFTKILKINLNGDKTSSFYRSDFNN